MGKRSTFERREADFYPTPQKAVLPLIPFLRHDGVRTFAESWRLGPALEAFGLRCVYAGDICTGQDALAINSYGAADAIITNPPFSRHSTETLKRMIVHFQHIAPTWLLLPLNFAANEYAAPFLPKCSHTVIIGRVKWFERTAHKSQENFAWYRFDAQHVGGPVLYYSRGHVDVIPERRRPCERCGKSYRPERSSARFCSPACRQRAYRKRISVTAGVTPTLKFNLPTKPSKSSEVFRYVRHADVPRFMAEGWELLPALDGTHHGEYSALMRRRG
jgi:hypothetical protein